jgi:multidrug efflux pump subunit AcrA (membrane-fusion protein)
MSDSRSKIHQAASFFLHWIAPLVVLGCAAWFFIAMGAREKPQRKKAPPRKSVPVEVVQAKPHLGELDIHASGVAIPYREVELAARVGGEVIFKSDMLSPGRSVTEGEVLIRLDPRDYELDVARLQQEVAKADVDLARLKIEKENTERLLVISKELVRLKEKETARLGQLRQSNAASQSEIDLVQAAYLVAKQQATDNENSIRAFADQENSLKIARDLASLQLKRAELDLQRTTITAPFSGVIIANHVEQNGNVTPGMAVATIEDTSMIEVRCSLRSQDLGLIQSSVPMQAGYRSTEEVDLNQPRTVRGEPVSPYELPPVAVTLEYNSAGRVYRWVGKLSRQDGLGMDQKTRTMPVLIRVDRPTSNLGAAGDDTPMALVRGMFVKAKLHCQPRTPFLVVPESVIRPGKRVWIMQAGQLQTHPIEIARIENGRAYIDPKHAALTVQDKIISSPVPNARDGLMVSEVGKKGPGRESGPNQKRANKDAKTSPLLGPNPVYTKAAAKRAPR